MSRLFSGTEAFDFTNAEVPGATADGGGTSTGTDGGSSEPGEPGGGGSGDGGGDGDGGTCRELDTLAPLLIIVQPGDFWHVEADTTDLALL